MIILPLRRFLVPAGSQLNSDTVCRGLVSWAFRYDSCWEDPGNPADQFKLLVVSPLR